MKRQKQISLPAVALLALPLAAAYGLRADESSPASTLTAACATARGGDFAAYRDTFSRAKLADMARAAEAGAVTCPATMQFGRENIAGQVATLDAWDPASEDRTQFRFVREDGDWKFAP